MLSSMKVKMQITEQKMHCKVRMNQELKYPNGQKSDSHIRLNSPISY